MRIKAAVLREIGKPLRVEEVELAPPKENEVLVKIAASGVCHSDWLIQHHPATTIPIVLGHEGSGIVVETGSHVKTVKAGDKVALNWNPYCGVCVYCTNNQVHLCDDVADKLRRGVLPEGSARLSRNGEAIHHTSLLSTFAEYAVVDEKSCVRLPDAMPLVPAALLGCAVPTGFGAAVHAAGIKPGQTVAVFGCGGVGLNAIQGARIAGAGTILACDIKRSNLEAAIRFGATHTVHVGKENAVEALREATGGYGVHAAIDATGSTKATASAWDGVRNGGTVVVVGRYTEPNLTISADMFHRKGKILRGSLYGDIHPLRDIPILAQLYLDGKLLLDEQILRRLTLPDINRAMDFFHDPGSGNIGHQVIVFDGANENGEQACLI